MQKLFACTCSKPTVTKNSIFLNKVVFSYYEFIGTITSKRITLRISIRMHRAVVRSNEAPS